MTCASITEGTIRVYDKATSSWVSQTTTSTGDIVPIKYEYGTEVNGIASFPSVRANDGSQEFNAAIELGYVTTAKLQSGKARLYYSGGYVAFVMPDYDVTIGPNGGGGNGD